MKGMGFGWLSGWCFGSPACSVLELLRIRLPPVRLPVRLVPQARDAVAPLGPRARDVVVPSGAGEVVGAAASKGGLP